jgi:hypothetical protein
MPSKQSVTLVFQSPSGAPLALGSVTFRLNVDISTALADGVQIAAQRLVKVALDSSGTCTVMLWPNNLLVPANSIYFVNAYTAQGQPAWSGELTVTE